MPAFDWYQATVTEPLDDVLEVLAGLVDGLKLSHGRGVHGYAHTAYLGSERHGDVAKVWHGGSHPYPHAVVTGQWAQAGAELIRASFPGHTVARVDVREDFEGEGVYDRMQAECLAVARGHRVKVGTAGDHLVTMKGRTLYLGSPSSNVRLRLYDKAEEVRASMAIPRGACPIAYARDMWGVPEHLTRLEAQIRPKGSAAKREFSTVAPTEALGCAPWMREVWNRCAGLEVEPCRASPVWRASDDERAYRFLLSQYGGVLRRMREDLGTWECVGLQLGEDLAKSS